MKIFRVIACLVTCLFVSGALPAQDTLYYENFESGGNSITRNTTDLGGTTAGFNQWWINNSYTGGSGSVICLGFPFSFTVNNTPAQPSGIFNNPNGFYLHTLSGAAMASFILCSSFIAADGICVTAESNFAKMNTGVNTSNYTNVGLKFWWHCGGGQNIWGELYYSTNGGTSWTQITSPTAQYKNQTTWVQQTVSLPAFDGQSDLRFAFRFWNAVSNTAIDPGFSIDDVVITGNLSGPAAAIATDPVGQSSYCSGDQVSIPYTVTGSFLSGNVFTAQLSDAGGSFASPTVLGSQGGTGSGSISVTLPTVAMSGSGYRIRVTGSNPPVNGTDNGSNIYIAAPPSVGNPQAVSTVLCSGDSALLFTSGSAGQLSWSLSLDGGTSFQPLPQFDGMDSLHHGPHYAAANNVYLLTAVSSPCPDDGVLLAITVDSILAGFSYTQSGPSSVQFTNNSFNGTFWSWSFGDGNSSTLQNPPIYSYATPGTYTVTLIAISANGCRDTVTDVVTILTGLEEAGWSLDWDVVPNPVRTTARVTADLFESGQLRLRVLDLGGREVERLFEGTVNGGKQVFAWHPDAGMTSGLYFMEMELNGRTYRKKVLLMRD